MGIKFPQIVLTGIELTSNGRMKVFIVSNKTKILYYGTCASKDDAPQEADTVVKNGRKSGLSN